MKVTITLSPRPVFPDWDSLAMSSLSLWYREIVQAILRRDDDFGETSVIAPLRCLAVP